jgi:hypothetical protein
MRSDPRQEVRGAVRERVPSRRRPGNRSSSRQAAAVHESKRRGGEEGGDGRGNRSRGLRYEVDRGARRIGFADGEDEAPGKPRRRREQRDQVDHRGSRHQCFCKDSLRHRQAAEGPGREAARGGLGAEQVFEVGVEAGRTGDRPGRGSGRSDRLEGSGRSRKSVQPRVRNGVAPQRSKNLAPVPGADGGPKKRPPGP